MLSALFAAIHLLGLVFGVAALVLRAKALSAVQSASDLRKVFTWDAVWGVVSIVWLGSGVYRAFGGLEKGTDYYLGNHVFWLKMLLVAIALALEYVPMTTLIRYRIQLKNQRELDLTRAHKLVRLHWYQLGVIALIVVSATFMARGIGSVPQSANANTLDPALAAGRAVYIRKCSSCHQLDGRGLGGKLAADFSDPARLAKTDAELLRSIEHGVPGTAMIGFGRELSDAETKQVLAYIRASFGKQTK